MKITVTFDKNSYGWERNQDNNLLFVTAQVNLLEDLYLHAGYLCFERVYSQLGLAWDPYDENKCWIHDRDGDLVFNILSKSSTNKVEITIHD